MMISVRLPFLAFVILLAQLSTTSHGMELVPGLNLFPSNVSCCPSLPLVGPAWQVHLVTSSIDVTDEENLCSFFPASDRPMVIIFQPIGTIIGWADYHACQSFQGSYQLSVNEDVDSDQPSSAPFRFEFAWNQWKLQPFSSCTQKSVTAAASAPACEDQDLDAFWFHLSTSVTSLVLTGYKTMELQNDQGITVVRLEAIPDSYECYIPPTLSSSSSTTSTIRTASSSKLSDMAPVWDFSCDPGILPNLGVSESSVRDYLGMGNADETMQESSGHTVIQSSWWTMMMIMLSIVWVVCLA